MKTIKKIFASLLTMGMLFTSLPVMAEGYTYTVTVSPGNHTIEGLSDTATFTSYAYGSEFNVNDYIGKVATETDSEGNKVEYRVLGARVAGKDNKYTQATFKITGNTDLVLTYVQNDTSNMTSYTVRYVDQDGNKLLDDEFHKDAGIISTSPVIPYKAIDGYIPQAYNLTKTLTENVDENVFTFRYTPSTVTVVTPGTTTTETVTTTTTDQGTTTTTGGETTTGGGDQGTTTTGGEETNEPADLINLDDEEQPLANLDDGESSTTSQSTFPTAYVVAGAGLLVLVLALIAFLRSKKQEQE